MCPLSPGSQFSVVSKRVAQSCCTSSDIRLSKFDAAVHQLWVASVLSCFFLWVMFVANQTMTICLQDRGERQRLARELVQASTNLVQAVPAAPAGPPCTLRCRFTINWQPGVLCTFVDNYVVHTGHTQNCRLVGIFVLFALISYSDRHYIAVS